MVCNVDTRQAPHHLRFTGRTMTAQGLGKTITALSLILSTRGVRPKPLPGTAAQTVTDRKGRQACYYLADPESKPAVHAAAIGSSRRSGRDSQPVRRFEAEAGTTKAARPKHAASSGPTTRSRHGSSSALAGQPVADPAAHKEQSSTAGAVPGPPQAPADAAVKAGSLRQHAAVEGEGNGPKTKRQKQDEPGDVVESKVLGLGKLECQKEKVAWTSWVQCNICNKWRSLPQVHTPLQIRTILPIQSGPLLTGKSPYHGRVHSSTSLRVTPTLRTGAPRGHMVLYDAPRRGPQGERLQGSPGEGPGRQPVHGVLRLCGPPLKAGRPRECHLLCKPCEAPPGLAGVQAAGAEVAGQPDICRAAGRHQGKALQNFQRGF